ncbi:type IV pili twitching motility protein PilT, partial [candidate division KSB1 bacterium]
TLIAVLSQTLIPRIDVRGRIAAFEFMVVTNAIANLIRDNKVYRIPSSIQTGKKFEMRLLDEHLFQLVVDGKIDAKDALDQAHEPSALQQKIEAYRKGQITLPQREEAAEAQTQQEDTTVLRR